MKKIVLFIFILLAALLVISAVGNLDSYAFQDIFEGTGKGESGGSANKGDSQITPMVYLSAEGIAYANTLDANFRLYEADTNLLIFEAGAVNREYDFSPYMEKGKFYYVVIDQILTITGGEYRGNTIVYLGSNTAEEPGSESGDDSGESTYTVTFGMDGVAQLHGNLTGECTWILYNEDGTEVARHPAEGIEYNFCYIGSDEIVLGMGYRYYVVCDLIDPMTGVRIATVQSEVVQFD